MQLKDTKCMRMGFIARIYEDKENNSLLIEVSQRFRGFEIVATKIFKSSVGIDYFNKINENNLQKFFDRSEIKIKLDDYEENNLPANDIITKFADEIPFIARKMFSGLDNDINWAILVILKKFGDCSFSDLEKITTLRKNELDNHIKKLIDSALIENYVQNKDGELKSLYEITLLALNILNSIDAWYWADEEK